MRTTLFSLLLLTQSVVYAQAVEPRNAIRIGINRAFFGSGDVVGPAFYAEYSYQLNPYFSLAPRILSGFANQGADDYRNYLNHISSLATNVSVRITPLPRYLPWFAFDIGGLYHRFVQTSGNAAGHSGPQLQAAYEVTNSSENLWGFIGAVNLDFAHQEKFTFGSRLELLTSLSEGYLNADSYQLGFYYGRKF